LEKGLPSLPQAQLAYFFFYSINMPYCNNKFGERDTHKAKKPGIVTPRHWNCPLWTSHMPRPFVIGVLFKQHPRQGIHAFLDQSCCHAIQGFPYSVLDRVNITHRSVGAASVNLAANISFPRSIDISFVAGSSLVDGVIHDDDSFFTQILVALWEGYIPQTYFNGVWSTPGLPATVFPPWQALLLPSVTGDPS
jgi:hypothetical protein